MVRQKGMFSMMNYYLPLKGIASMHCSANTDMNGENTAIFFGLSGTGKTTLSTDPKRLLIGDDEHGYVNAIAINELQEKLTRSANKDTRTNRSIRHFDVYPAYLKDFEPDFVVYNASKAKVLH